MKKIVLWGAGFYGQSAYHKTKAQFEIIGFVDENAVTAGGNLFGIPVISVAELREMYSAEIDIVICTEDYFRVSTQLIETGINEYYVMMEGFLYHSSADKSMMPVELSTYSSVKKEKGEKNVLYVQSMADGRTKKMAAAMKEAGYKVYLLYMLAPQENGNGNFSDIYDGEFTFYTANGVIDFIENSDFDLVHSVGDSLGLTNIVLAASRHVVFDVGKDQCECETVEALFLKHVADIQSDGIIYRSRGDADKRSCRLEKKEVLFLNEVNRADALIGFYEKVRK